MSPVLPCGLGFIKYQRVNAVLVNYRELPGLFGEDFGLYSNRLKVSGWFIPPAVDIKVSRAEVLGCVQSLCRICEVHIKR